MTIQDIIKKRDKTAEELRKLEAAITAFQEICEHQWTDDGHDSHHSYHKCKICQLSEKC